MWSGCLAGILLTERAWVCYQCVILCVIKHKSSPMTRQWDWIICPMLAEILQESRIVHYLPCVGGEYRSMSITFVSADNRNMGLATGARHQIRDPRTMGSLSRYGVEKRERERKKFHSLISYPKKHKEKFRKKKKKILLFGACCMLY
jgi:hypothetical protein